jgi:hypothetical protein
MLPPTRLGARNRRARTHDRKGRAHTKIRVCARMWDTCARPCVTARLYHADFAGSRFASTGNVRLPRAHRISGAGLLTQSKSVTRR